MHECAFRAISRQRDYSIGSFEYSGQMLAEFSVFAPLSVSFLVYDRLDNQAGARRDSGTFNRPDHLVSRVGEEDAGGILAGNNHVPQLQHPKRNVVLSLRRVQRNDVHAVALIRIPPRVAPRCHIHFVSHLHKPAAKILGNGFHTADGRPEMCAGDENRRSRLLLSRRSFFESLVKECPEVFRPDLPIPLGDDCLPGLLAELHPHIRIVSKHGYGRGERFKFTLDNHGVIVGHEVFGDRSIIGGDDSPRHGCGFQQGVVASFQVRRTDINVD